MRETWGIAGSLKRDPGYVVYRADCDGNYDDVGNPVARWRPSLFMKRDDSRITLEVTEVRVQRLQDISEEDAKAEGVRYCDVCDDTGIMRIEHDPEWCHECGGSAQGRTRDEFAALWDTINGDRASWESNPFVWCVSFKVLKTKR